jgi:hypothetical protein
MEDTDKVVNPFVEDTTDDVELTTETPSTSVKESDSEVTETDEAPSASDEIPEPDEDAVNQEEEEKVKQDVIDEDTDLPKTEKGQRRMQEIVNRNKQLEKELSEYKSKSGLETDLKLHDEFIEAYKRNDYALDKEGNYLIDQDGNYLKMQDIQEYKIQVLSSKLERQEIEGRINKERAELEAKHTKADKIVASTPFLNRESSDYIEGAEEFFNKRFNKGEEPDEIVSDMKELLNAGLSRGMAQKRSSLADKQSQITSSNGNNTAPAKDPKYMSYEEHTQWLKETGQYTPITL